MFKYYSSYALLWMGLTHLLCCGLPLILSIVSLSTNIVSMDTFFFDSELLGLAEPYFFTITTLIFLFIISLEIYNKKIKCQDDECCIEEECNFSKNKIKLNLILSGLLYLINSSIFLSEKLV